MQNYRRYTLKESNQDQEVLDIIAKSLQYQDLDVLKRIFNVTIESVDEATELIKVDILQIEPNPHYFNLPDEDDDHETTAQREMREYLDSIDEEF